MNTKKTLAMAAMAVVALAGTTIGAQADTRTQKSFGGWQVDCNQPDGGKETCALQYSLVSKKDNRPIFSWAVMKGDKEGDVNKALVRTPTGVLLSEGVNIGFEGADPVKIAYFTCGPQGCLAKFDFTDQWSKALSGNQKVVVNLKAANEKPVKFEIDLKQFSDAYAYFKSQIGDK